MTRATTPRRTPRKPAAASPLDPVEAAANAPALARALESQPGDLDECAPAVAPAPAPEAAAQPAQPGATEVLLYCDGACSPNPGLGGWGVVLLAPGRDLRKELSGAERETTNNRMELTAALMGLRSLRRPTRVTIITDSEYLKNAFTAGWMIKWRRNGWMTSARTPVKNCDLWRALAEAMEPHQVQWQWVRGHASNEENNRCDELAVSARLRLKKALGENS